MKNSKFFFSTGMQEMHLSRDLSKLVSEAPYCSSSTSSPRRSPRLPATMMRLLWATLALAASAAAVASHDDVNTATVACVTGCTGFLGTEVVAQLLAQGHTVRGTVRSLGNAAKTAPLLALPGADSRLTLVEADLLGGEDAFASCVEGADILYHTASPFTTSGITDPHKQLIEPAVEGTRAAVRAAIKQEGTVTAIVLTSSRAAAMGPQRVERQDPGAARSENQSHLTSWI